MLYDEDVYSDPFNFVPERFLDDEGQLDPSVRQPEDIAFGFGRRYVEFTIFTILWVL